MPKEASQNYSDWAKENRKPIGDKLKAKIIEKHGNIEKMLEKEPKISRQFVQDLIHGRKTRMSDRIKLVYELIK